ncbi:hypothetical protein [Micromonospora haikouensis]
MTTELEYPQGIAALNPLAGDHWRRLATMDGDSGAAGGKVR